MRSFLPTIKVTLVKTARRGSMGEGIEAASRYKQFDAVDLTKCLAENAPVTLHRSVADSAGQWSMMLVDKMLPEYGETVYAMIEPNDVIEIAFAHNAADYQGKPPVVMRGFVSRARRRRAIDPSGQPMRVITVTGHDYGKILEILRIYYLNNSVIGDNIVSELKFFQKYADFSQAKIMSAIEFTKLVLDVLINPFLDRLTRDGAGNSVGSAVVHKMTAKATIKGTVNPFDVSAFQGGSVGEFLKSLLDVGAFNELLVEDAANGVDLVIRPNPYLGLDGKRIQEGEEPEVITVTAEDLVDIEEERSDSNVANYFWVNNHQWQIMTNDGVKALAVASGVEEYALMDYTNTAAARYGFKKMEIGSALGPDSLEYREGAREEQRQTEADLRATWLAERRRVLALQNRDNVVFESGHLLLRGNERIKRGMYLRVDHGNGYAPLHYVTAVTHQFVLFGAFTTFVQFERGTGFVDRAKQESAPYLSEMNFTGA